MEATLASIIILAFFLGVIFLIALVWWRIIGKTGYHPAIGLLLLLPVVNFIMLLMLAFTEWPIRRELKQLRQGAFSPPQPLSKSKIVIVVLFGIIPLLSLLTVFAMKGYMHAKLTANDAGARAKVRIIATALESYAAAHEGKYPTNEYDLVYAQPPYLNQTYNDKTVTGYYYTVKLQPQGYEIVASPAGCKSTGLKIFLKESGKDQVESDCKY